MPRDESVLRAPIQEMAGITVTRCPSIRSRRFSRRSCASSRRSSLRRPSWCRPWSRSACGIQRGTESGEILNSSAISRGRHPPTWASFTTCSRNSCGYGFTYVRLLLFRGLLAPRSPTPPATGCPTLSHVIPPVPESGSLQTLPGRIPPRTANMPSGRRNKNSILAIVRASQDGRETDGPKPRAYLSVECRRTSHSCR